MHLAPRPLLSKRVRRVRSPLADQTLGIHGLGAIGPNRWHAGHWRSSRICCYRARTRPAFAKQSGLEEGQGPERPGTAPPGVDIAPGEALRQPADAPQTDVFPMECVDYLELWVGNAKQAAFYFEHAYGFTPVAYRGPETGTRDRAILWSISGLEGTLNAPKQVFLRSGRDGEACDGPYMCESNACDPDTQRCVPSRDDPAPVFDYRAINRAMLEIATRRYAGKQRRAETYQAILMADGAIPYSTIVAVMGAMRCKLPDFGKEVPPCALPTEDPALKQAREPISPNGKLFDTSRATYDPKQMALFHDILFSSGFE